MEERTRCFELRTGDGQVILTFNLVEKQATTKPNPKAPENFEKGGNGGKEQSPPANNDFITEAQKRYLFRILADHGIQGEIAHQELKSAFRVDSLTDVSKFEASKMIERLLGNGIGGLKNGTPIQ